MQEHRIPDTVRGHDQVGAGPVLPSRARALDALVDLWTTGGTGIRILTGAPGAGKSWLWRMAIERTREIRTNLHWVWMPHWPSARGADLLRALLGSIDSSGFSGRMSLERLYVHAERSIRDFHEDGFGIRVVVEESHHLGHEGYESIRILQERLRPFGIDMSVLFVGRTPLARGIQRVSGEPRPAGWHLPQISLPETMELLNWLGGSRRLWTRAEADWIHREALGNPRRIIRWAESIPGKSHEPDKPMIKPGFGHGPGESKPAISGVSLLAEPLIPSRPPLAESEGVIEVGYPDDDLPGDVDLAWLPQEELGSLPDRGALSDPESPASQEFRASTSRYRLEPGDTFAPYGLRSSRPESIPERPAD